MREYTREDLEKYLENDYILELLQDKGDFEQYASHRWLRDIPAKRMIFADIYGELLRTEGLKVLDIAGGFSSISIELMRRHDYQLIDILETDEQTEDYKKALVWDDWSTFEIKEQYDVIICNDLFPNSDQRLYEFIEKYAENCSKLIMSITSYEDNRSYIVRREDNNEVITYKPWNYRQINTVLGDISTNIGYYIPRILKPDTDSIFNGIRKVYKLEL